MKKNLLEIYALAVCFFTVACFVIVLGMAVWDGLQITNPEFTLNNHLYQKYQSDEAYKQHLISMHRHQQDAPDIPEGEALSKERIEGFNQALKGEARAGFQSLVKNLIILFIDFFVFAVHWFIAARARRSAS